uniref:Claudin domain-containing protein 2-like n=1 Tax=Pogona vitticeps TaxID=103695 RepID=A0ABM5ERE3_9SAUR
MNVLQISSVVCSFVSLLLLLLSLGSNYWVMNGDRHAGLWNLCDPTVCVSFGLHVGVVDHIARALMLLGMIGGAVSFFGLCATFFKSQVGSMSLMKTSANASILAAFWALIAMASFTGVTSHLTVSYGWSFSLGWASCLLFLITGVLTHLARRDLSGAESF